MIPFLVKGCRDADLNYFPVLISGFGSDATLNIDPVLKAFIFIISTLAIAIIRIKIVHKKGTNRYLYRTCLKGHLAEVGSGLS
jgi:hypothetical protein